MAGDPTNPEMGEVVFNGAEFISYLVDLQPAEMQGMRTALEGFAEVIKEIVSNHAIWGAKAGVTADDIEQLVTCTEHIARIDVFIPPVMKFAEMLTETRYKLEDRRQRVALNVAQSVDRRGVREPQLLAKYEKTRSYRSLSAKKAAKTRRQNEAAQAAQAAEAAETNVEEPAVESTAAPSVS